MRRVRASLQAVRDPHNLPAGKLQITMSHALTNAAHGLSLAEKRVMMYAVAKLDVFKGDGGFSDGKVTLQAHEYAEQFGISHDTAYNQLKSAGDAIFERHIQWFEGGKSEIRKRIRWVSGAEYNKGEGTVSLWFTQQVAPHLLGLRNRFTTYKLAQASALRSLYSWRLLELLSQQKELGFRQISLLDFHHAMETPAGYKDNFKTLRQRVLEPAVKELCEKDDWAIDWYPIKTGRKVTSLRFEFKRNKKDVVIRVV